MKNVILLMLLLSVILSSCGPSQKITGSWINREALPKGPFKSVFVLVISQNTEANYEVEYQMAKVFNSRGVKAVKSTDKFPPKFSVTRDLSKEQLAESIKKYGCDAVFTIALLDTKSETRYQPGAAPYYPAGFGYTSNYYGYYNYNYSQVYSPGYYSTSKTYYLECNFYDMTSDLLLFSIQSEATSPKDLTSMFKSYSYMILNHLKKEKVITK
jgi:hypothetical protein